MKVLLASLIVLVLLTSHARAGVVGTDDANQAFKEDVIQAIEDKMDEKIAAAKEGKKELMAFLEEKVVESLGRIEEKVDEIVEKQLFVEFCVRQNSCGEHGTCNVVNGTYQCTCDEGYIGDHCEQKDLCYNVECQNEGTCVVRPSADSYKCQCKSPWTGNHCEIMGPCAKQLLRDAPYKPKCDEGGFYAPVQHWKRRVLCVERESGRPIPRYRLRPESVTTESCKCAQEEATAGLSSPDIVRFKCARDGSYM